MSAPPCDMAEIAGNGSASPGAFDVSRFTNTRPLAQKVAKGFPFHSLTIKKPEAMMNIRGCPEDAATADELMITCECTLTGGLEKRFNMFLKSETHALIRVKGDALQNRTAWNFSSVRTAC